LLLGGLAACAPAANAREVDDNFGRITETVAFRERLRDYDKAKEYDAKSVRSLARDHVSPNGLRARNFYRVPELESSVTYDDNIFASNQQREADMRSELAPSVQLRSYLPRHVLNMAFGARMVNYLHTPDLNYVNGQGLIEGALHIDHAHTLSMRFMSEYSHEEIGDSLAPRDAAEPVPVFSNRLAIGLTRDVGRLYGTISAQYQRQDFFDVASRNGGISDQDDRDQDTMAAQIRAGYRFSPGFEFVAKMKFLRQIAFGAGGDDTIDRWGYDALAGLSFETGPLIRWSLMAGYGIRDFDDPTRRDLESSLLEARVQWLPTRKITVLGSVRREFSDRIGDDFGASVRDQARARIDFDVYNNVILSVSGGIEKNDFVETERIDWSYVGQIGIEYLLNENWSFTLNYDYEKRDSSEDGFDFDRNRIMFGAKLRF